MTLAIVTGGTRGIGKAISLELSQKYDTVVSIYHGNDKAAEKLEKENQNIITRKCDVSDITEVSECIKEIYKEFGTIDCLINNAGITRDGYFLMMSPEKWSSVLNTNLMGTVNLCREVLRIMKKNKKGGTVVNMSSICGVAGNAGQANYAASKGAIIALTKSLAKEFVGDDITINSVSPGYIDTDMTVALDNRDKIKNNIIPVKRFGTAQEVAFLVEFLVSKKAKYITGQNFVIDGGMI